MIIQRIRVIKILIADVDNRKRHICIYVFAKFRLTSDQRIADDKGVLHDFGLCLVKDVIEIDVGTLQQLVNPVALVGGGIDPPEEIDSFGHLYSRLLFLLK